MGVPVRRYSAAFSVKVVVLITLTALDVKVGTAADGGKGHLTVAQRVAALSDAELISFYERKLGKLVHPGFLDANGHLTPEAEPRFKTFARDRIRLQEAGVKIEFKSDLEFPREADIAFPVGRMSGANGSVWTFRSNIFNTTGGMAGVVIGFYPRQDDSFEPAVTTWYFPGHQNIILENTVDAVFGFEYCPDPECDYIGTFVIDILNKEPWELSWNGSFEAHLPDFVSATTFRQTRLWETVAAGETVYMPGSVDVDHTRFNIGMYCLTDNARVQLMPLDHMGEPLREWPKAYALNSLGESLQINNVYKKLGFPNEDDVLYRLKVIEGKVAFYGTVIDGVRNGDYEGTSDGTLVLPYKTAESVFWTELGWISGVTKWKSQGAVTNLSNYHREITFEFIDRAGNVDTRVLTFAPWQTMGFRNPFEEILGWDGPRSGPAAAGAWKITSRGDVGGYARSYSLLTEGCDSETWPDDDPDDSCVLVGTMGQLVEGKNETVWIAPRSEDEAATYFFSGLIDPPGDARAHAVFFNSSQVETTFNMRMFDGETNVMEGNKTWNLGSREILRLNNIIQKFGQPESGRVKHFEFYSSESKMYGAAYQINEYGDPISITPVRRGPPPEYVDPIADATDYVRKWLPPRDSKLYLAAWEVRVMLNSRWGTRSYSRDLAEILLAAPVAAGTSLDEMDTWLRKMADGEVLSGADEICFDYGTYDPFYWDNDARGDAGVLIYHAPGCTNVTVFDLDSTGMNDLYTLVSGINEADEPVDGFLRRLVANNPDLFGGEIGGVPDRDHDPKWNWQDELDRFVGFSITPISTTNCTPNGVCEPQLGETIFNCEDCCDYNAACESNETQTCSDCTFASCSPPPFVNGHCEFLNGEDCNTCPSDCGLCDGEFCESNGECAGGWCILMTCSSTAPSPQ